MTAHYLGFSFSPAVFPGMVSGYKNSILCCFHTLSLIPLLCEASADPQDKISPNKCLVISFQKIANLMRRISHVHPSKLYSPSYGIAQIANIKNNLSQNCQKHQMQTQLSGIMKQKVQSQILAVRHTESFLTILLLRM